MKRFSVRRVVYLGVILLAGATTARGDLTGYWAFDEGSGATAFDLSPGGHDGTINGATWSSDATRTTHLLFNGSSDYVSVGPIGLSGNAPRTISGWAKSNDAAGNDGGWTGIFGFIPNTGGISRYFDVEVRGGGAPKPYCLHLYGQEENFGVLTDDPNWRHFAATYDGTTVRMYRDGVPAYSFGPNNSPLDTWDEVNMGRREATGQYFNGAIDEVAIYDNALAPNQVAHLAAGGDPTALPSPPISVFYIGVDNGNNSEFDHENDADDHYYWEDGDYSGLGTGGANWTGGQEDWSGGDSVTGFDRALIAGDPTNYIYFQLEDLEAAADAQFSLISDMVQPDGTHDLEFRMNGAAFHTETGIGTKLVTDTFTGADVGAVPGSNVIEILRTGGPGGWIQFDYVSLEVVPGAAVIPEPSTFVLAALGLLGLGLCRWRRWPRR